MYRIAKNPEGIEAVIKGEKDSSGNMVWTPVYPGLMKHAEYEDIVRQARANSPRGGWTAEEIQNSKYKLGKDPEGNTAVLMGAPNSKGEMIWEPVEVRQIPKSVWSSLANSPEAKAGNLSAEVVNNVFKKYSERAQRRLATSERNKERKFEDKLDQWEEAVATGRESLVREAKDMGFWKSGAIHAGRESDKLVAGAKDIGQILQGMSAPALDAIGIGGQPIEENLANRKAIAEDQFHKDDAYKYLDDNSFWSKILKIGPYVATGGIEPLATRAMASGVSGLGRGALAAGNTGVRAGRSTASKLSDIAGRGYNNLNLPRVVDTPIREVANKIKGKYSTEIKAPISSYVSHVKARPPIDTPLKGWQNRLMGSAVLSGAESGVHYDENIMDGVISGVLGTGIGLANKNRLSQSRNQVRASPSQTIKDWYERGYRIPPGMETGKVEIQQLTSAMRNSPRYASGMRDLDNANNRAVSNHVARAIGMEPGALADITEESLRSHMNALGKKFDDVQGDTHGIVDPDDFTNIINNLDVHTPEVNRVITKAFLDLGDTFDGATYKKIHAEIKDRANTAIGRNDDAYKVYREFLEQMDNSVRRGIGAKGGTPAESAELIQRWNDARERYAMANFVLENGLDANHNVDMSKMANDLMTNDSKRLLLGEGNMIKSFHDIAKLHNIQRTQANAQLGDGSNAGGAPPIEHGVMSHPGTGDLGPIDAFLFERFKGGYPNRKGYLGLPREGAFSSENLFRAMQQANDPIQNTAKGIWNAGVNTKKYMDENYSWLWDMFKEQQR